MKRDPKVQELLERAASPEAQRRVAVFDALSAAFRVEAAGIDVTPRGPARRPAGEPAVRKPRRRG